MHHKKVDGGIDMSCYKHNVSEECASCVRESLNKKIIQLEAEKKSEYKRGFEIGNKMIEEKLIA